MADSVLTINSRNYGSWSLRGFLLCRMAGLDCTVEMSGLDDPEPMREYVEHTARKRLAFLIEPTKIVSCDHRRLR